MAKILQDFLLSAAMNKLPRTHVDDDVVAESPLRRNQTSQRFGGYRDAACRIDAYADRFMSDKAVERQGHDRPRLCLSVGQQPPAAGTPRLFGGEIQGRRLVE